MPTYIYTVDTPLTQKHGSCFYQHLPLPTIPAAYLMPSLSVHPECNQEQFSRGNKINENLPPEHESCSVHRKKIRTQAPIKLWDFFFKFKACSL